MIYYLLAGVKVQRETHAIIFVSNHLHKGKTRLFMLYCDKCGLCCRMLACSKEMEEFDRGDGVCKFLKNNLCSIYEKRPDICDAEYMWITYYSRFMTRQEFEEKSYETCKALKAIFSTKEDLNNG